MSDQFAVEVDLKMDNILVDSKEMLKIVNHGLVFGALTIANTWKQLAPFKSGTYKRSIHVAGHANLTPDFKGEAFTAPTDKLTAMIGTRIKDPPYPEFLEFGTSRMQAKPSAGPAMGAARNAALKEVGDATRAMLAQRGKAAK